jgi:hypothetical protein
MLCRKEVVKLVENLFGGEMESSYWGRSVLWATRGALIGGTFIAVFGLAAATAGADVVRITSINGNYDPDHPAPAPRPQPGHH